MFRVKEGHVRITNYLRRRTAMEICVKKVKVSQFVFYVCYFETP